MKFLSVLSYSPCSIRCTAFAIHGCCCWPLGTATRFIGEFWKMLLSSSLGSFLGAKKKEAPKKKRIRIRRFISALRAAMQSQCNVRMTGAGVDMVFIVTVFIVTSYGHENVAVIRPPLGWRLATCIRRSLRPPLRGFAACVPGTACKYMDCKLRLDRG